MIDPKITADIIDSDFYKNYESYLHKNYSNQRTVGLYLSLHRKFIRDLNIEPSSIKGLTQDLIDMYLTQLNSSKSTNSCYKGYLKSLVESYDPTGRLFIVPKRLTKSRSRINNVQDSDYMTFNMIQKLANCGDPYIETTIRVLYETGLRKGELLGFDTSQEKNVLDLVNRTIQIVGKGNKVSKVPFSELTAQYIYEFSKSPYCLDPTRPFMLFTKQGLPHKDQGKIYYRLLQRAADNLGITLQSGRKVFPHSIRRGFAHLLEANHFTPFELQAAMRHSDIRNTARYCVISGQDVRAKQEQVIFANPELNIPKTTPSYIG